MLHSNKNINIGVTTGQNFSARHPPKIGIQGVRHGMSSFPTRFLRAYASVGIFTYVIMYTHITQFHFISIFLRLRVYAVYAPMHAISLQVFVCATCFADTSCHIICPVLFERMINMPHIFQYTVISVYEYECVCPCEHCLPQRICTNVLFVACFQFIY